MLPAHHPPVARPRIGVLVTNLGTPDAPTTSAVRRYLKQFLSDRRVVEIPPILWQPILRGIILNVRPRKSAAAYREVWQDGGSPLAIITRNQAAALQARMGDAVMVEYAMRYGNPGIDTQLAAMKAAGCERILLAPLYPQYSGATTATANDAAFAALAKMRWQPAIRTLPPYYDDRAYIDTLVASIRSGLAALDFAPEVVMLTFHGMPQRTLDLGDPYHCHCRKTARRGRGGSHWLRRVFRPIVSKRSKNLRFVGANSLLRLAANSSPIYPASMIANPARPCSKPSSAANCPGGSDRKFRP